MAARERDEAARSGRKVATAEVVEDDSSEDEATARRARARARQATVAEVVQDDSDEEAARPAPAATKVESEEDEDDEAIDRRRAAARARNLARRKAEEEAAAVVVEEKEEEEEDEEGSTEWETDTDDEEEQATARLKPKFVPRHQRETILEQERLEEEAAQAAEREAEKKKERKQESKAMVEDILRKEEEEANQDLSDEDMPDDDDEIDEDQEYEKWKLREVLRIKKEREERNRAAVEAAETLRRRNLTDEERAAEDAAEEAKAKADGQFEVKKKWKHMQKYYHKGSFFQDTNKFGVSEYDELFNRDFGGATLEDNYDKSALPKVMQVKKFGFSGQTKYTHLKDQDTSTTDTPWAQQSRLRQQYTQKMGGMGGDFAKPAGKKKSS